jgi:hypothetical protein
MPIILVGRIMSVELSEARPETKESRAKESMTEIEIYVARKRNEIVKAPAHLHDRLKALEGDEVSIECASYSEWAVGNRTGISFNFGSLLDDEGHPVALGFK